MFKQRFDVGALGELGIGVNSNSKEYDRSDSFPFDY